MESALNRFCLGCDLSSRPLSRKGYFAQLLADLSYEPFAGGVGGWGFAGTDGVAQGLGRAPQPGRALWFFIHGCHTRQTGQAPGRCGSISQVSGHYQSFYKV